MPGTGVHGQCSQKRRLLEKEKIARGVGRSAGAQEGVPEHQKEVGWVAQKLIGEGVEWYQIWKKM